MGQGNSELNEIPSLLMAAHELKSPLVLIRQLALQIEDQSSSDLSAERIRLTAERSLRLVDSLTKTARLEDGMFVSEPIVVSGMFNDIAHELEPLAKALNQSIEIRLPRRPLTVLANRQLMQSVLLGLCDNALTHNSDDRAVVLSAGRRGGRIETRVRDYGQQSGYIQSSRVSTSGPAPIDGRPRSSGLGLMIAQHFSQHMQADLTLTKHRQRGVSAIVNLPESSQLSLLDLSL